MTFIRKVSLAVVLRNRDGAANSVLQSQSVAVRSSSRRERVGANNLPSPQADKAP